VELGAKHLGRLAGLRSGLKRHFAAHQRGFHTGNWGQVPINYVIGT